MEEKKKKSNWLGVVGCIIAAVALFIICIAILNKTVKKVETVEVVAFSQNVTHQTEINSENVKDYFCIIEVVKQSKPENTYVTIEEIVKEGRVFIDGTYVKNEVLTQEKVISQKKIEDSYTDRVETSFKVAAFDSAVSGTVRAGDRINITVVENSNGNEKYTIDNVYVASAFTSDGTIIKANDTTAIAVGFTIWLNGSELTDFNTSISSGVVKVSKMTNR